MLTASVGRVAVAVRQEEVLPRRGQSWRRHVVGGIGRIEYRPEGSTSGRRHRCVDVAPSSWLEHSPRRRLAAEHAAGRAAGSADPARRWKTWRQQARREGQLVALARQGKRHSSSPERQQAGQVVAPVERAHVLDQARRAPVQPVVGRPRRRCDGTCGAGAAGVGIRFDEVEGRVAARRRRRVSRSAHS